MTYKQENLIKRLYAERELTDEARSAYVELITAERRGLPVSTTQASELIELLLACPKKDFGKPSETQLEYLYELVARIKAKGPETVERISQVFDVERALRIANGDEEVSRREVSEIIDQAKFFARKTK